MSNAPQTRSTTQRAKSVYIVEYRARNGATERWKAWRTSIDAGKPFMQKRIAETCAQELQTLAGAELQYRVSRYQRITDASARRSKGRG